MALRRYHETRSARLTIIPPDGRSVVVKNLRANVGHRIRATVRKTATPAPDSAVIDVFNLGAEDRGRVESTRGDLGSPLDLAAYGDPVTPFGEQRPPDAARLDRLSRVELEVGYDGQLTTVFSAISASVLSRREGATLVTTITGLDGIDGDLFGSVNEAFEVGAQLFDVVDVLRRRLGLAPGNLTRATWEALVGSATISTPAILSGDSATVLDRIFEYLVTTDNQSLVRWFRTGGAFYVWRADGSVAGAPARPWPYAERPARLDDGRIGLATMLAPDVTPGRLVEVRASLGEGPGAVGPARADVPPGLYPCAEVEHRFDTSARALAMARTSMVLNGVSR